jgi:DNA-binding beta-propeller fold protein YncE
LDTDSLAERGTVKLGDDADNVRFDARTGLLYVGYGDGALAVLNSATLEMKPEIHLSAHPESFQLEPAGKRVFINTPGGVIGGGGSIVVADLDSRSVRSTWKLREAGRNFPMALDGSRLYVGCRRPAKLLVIDAATGTTIAALDCVGDADDVFVDAARSRVYVSGGDGKLDVFTGGDPDHYKREQIDSAPGARTSLFVPETSRLYVAAPSGKGHPARILVYDAKGAAQPVGP